MKRFRETLSEIEDCINSKRYETDSELKSIWNNLSSAITEFESRPRNAQEVIKELYEQNNVDGLWSVHLDDLNEEQFPFEIQDWMYSYALSLQPKQITIENCEVGDMFKYEGLVLRCTPGGCNDCYIGEIKKCNTVKCTSKERSDNRTVKFVKQ